jgi:tripartite-type tricarboxylate transporter receptor subunit TctC
MNRILAMDDIKKTFHDAGVEPMGGSTQQFDAYFKAQTARWGKVIKDANIVAD